MMQNLRDIRDIGVHQKSVLVRVDYNVPIKDGIILDATRITRTLDTINYLLSNNAKVVLISHFGNPSTPQDPAFSLIPVFKYLSANTNLSIKFCPNLLGQEAHTMIKNLRSGEVLLLENLRFYKQEKANDDGFAKKLADLCDIYVNDAFSCCHRKHASIHAIAKYKKVFAGLLLQKEISSLNSFFQEESKPSIAIVGGKKVSSKFGVLKSLINQVDRMVIGGAMANTFLKANGFEVGQSYYEATLLKEVKAFFQNNQKKLYLPSDFVCRTVGASACEVLNISGIKPRSSIYDIGPKSCMEIVSILDNAKTVMWNGPLGCFEIPEFRNGSAFVARYIAKMTTKNGLKSIVGGGDVGAVIKASKLENSFSYISTAGGAFLKWLEDKKLPGVEPILKSTY